MSTRRRIVAILVTAGTLVLAPFAGADAPAVSITGGTSGVVASHSASFDFTVDDPAATVECSVGGGFSGCSSGDSFSGLGDGDHTFTVQATNVDGTNSDSRSWTVDTTGPSLSLPPVVVNVNDVSSGIASYSPSGSDPHGPVSVICSPASGSSFPLGISTVNCTGTDGLTNTSTGSFTVTVRDTTPPTLTTPSNMTVSVNGVTSTPVSFSVTSSAGTPSCTPSSGSSFALGTTSVNCTATDASGNTGSKSFTVKVQDVTPPILNVPATQTVSVNAATSATVSYTVSAHDAGATLTPSCAPSSGSSFPLGTTTVSCTATDAAGLTASGSFSVVVQDTTAPTVSITGGPTGTVASTTASIPFTTNEGTLACSLDSASFAGCSSPASLSGLTDGSHTFQVRATDAAGNAATASRSWTVDATPPTFVAPTSVVVEANGSAGAVVSYAVTAADDGVPLLPSAVACAPASRSLFPLGTTAVQCTAADSLGNIGTVTFNVLVSDTTPPSLAASDITLAATSVEGIRRTDPAMAAFLSSLRGTDLVSSVKVTTNAPGVFPVGKTSLLVRAVDGALNASERTVTVTVLPFGQAAPPPPDLDAPDSVTQLRATAKDHAVTLTWVVPTATDLAAIEVRMTEVGGTNTDRVVSRAVRADAAVTGLRNGVEYRFVVTAVDKAGNESRGAVVLATPQANLLATPKAGTKVRKPPLLRWAPLVGTSYYNVQLYRGKAKVLSAWPTRAKVQLTRSWMYEKVRRTLLPGTYTWYVWPGFGARADVKYGTVMGKSTFVVVAGQNAG
jgi:HYR domain